MPISTSTILRKGLILLALVFIFLGGITSTYAQTRSYLKGQKTGNFLPSNLITLGTGSAGISAPINQHNYVGFRYFYGDESVLTDQTSTATTLRAAQDVGVANVLGAGGDVYLQFRNTNNVSIPGGTTTYFYLKNRPTNSGISLAVGGLLGLVELNNIQGIGYSGASNYQLQSGIGFYNGSENNGTPVAQNSTRLLIDGNGEWYAAVTPASSYNSVRLNVALPSDLRVADVARSIEATVHNAFVQTVGSPCNILPQFTNAGEASGINLNTGASGIALNQLIANPERAINTNPNDYSSFSTGVANLGVASTLSQTFYFDHTVAATEVAKFKIGLEQSLISASALGNSIRFLFYNGTSETPVYSTTLNGTLLGANILDLITINGSYGTLNATVTPNVAFNRVKVEFDPGLLAVGALGDAFRIYDVKALPKKPVVTPTSHTVLIYAGQIPSAIASSPGNDITWFTSTGTALPGGPMNSTYPFPVTVSVNSDFYAQAAQPGCTTPTSDTTYLRVNVLTLTYSNPPDGIVGQPYSGAVSATPSISGRDLQYALVAGSTLPDGLMLSTSGIIMGTPTVTTPPNYTFNVTITDVTNGGNLPAGTHVYPLRIASPLTLATIILPNGQAGSEYTPYTVPEATGGTPAYTYAVNNLPPGLTFNPATRQISGTPTQPGTFNNITVTVNDAGSPAQTITQTTSLTITEQPTPVTLIAFTAKAAGSNVQLEWATAQEKNNARFEVQHSTNGRDFETVGSLDGKGTVATRQNYSFVHASVNPAFIHYYRLKQVDLDGKSTLSPVRSVKLDGYVGIAMKASTDPSRNVRVFVDYDNPQLSSHTTLHLMDLSGRTLSSKQLTLEAGRNTVEFSSTMLGSGIYLIRMDNNSHTSATKVVLP